MDCPECGTILFPSGRCSYCPSCGWSLCSLGGDIDEEEKVDRSTEEPASIQE